MNNDTHNYNNSDCQMQSIPKIRPEKSSLRETPFPPVSQVRLFFRRHLSIETRHKVKKVFRLDHSWQSKEIWVRNQPRAHSAPGLLDLKAGEQVRVRSKEEILATLDADGKLKGCSFIGGMWQYCETARVVLKPVNRFVDERNYKIVYAKGLVLLDGAICSGTNFYGNCDRSCFFFWREEWLERI